MCNYREDHWSLFTEYRVHLARQARDLGQAERLQRKRVDWNRQRRREALAAAPASRDAAQNHAIRTLAASLHELGDIRREFADPTCIASYQQSFDLARSIGEKSGQAACAFNLAKAYTNIAAIRDFDVAERWLRQSLELRAAGDAQGRGATRSQLGKLSLSRFDEAVEQNRPAEECAAFLHDAEKHYLEALRLTPSTAIRERGVDHNQLGAVYSKAGRLELAAPHYQQGIRYCEQAGDIYGAAQTRSNVALMFLDAARFADARAYAEAALANFREFGDRAADDVADTERLLAKITAAEAQHGKT